MKSKIMILNVLKYEKDGKKGTRLSIIFPGNDNVQETEKFKGFADVSLYYSNHDAFDIIPSEIIGQIVEATIEEKSNPSNPLRKTTTIISIAYKDKVYNLC